MKTSKQAAEFGPMLDAIRNAAHKCQGEPLDFIADLHEAGFMVVPSDAVVLDTVMIEVPDEPVTSLLNKQNTVPAAQPAQPAEELAKQQAGPKRPEGMDDAEALAFAEWWAGCLAYGCMVNESFNGWKSEDWLFRFRAKMTPEDANRDAVPF